VIYRKYTKNIDRTKEKMKLIENEKDQIAKLESENVENCINITCKESLNTAIVQKIYVRVTNKVYRMMMKIERIHW
jgi:hypothetical protein